MGLCLTSRQELHIVVQVGLNERYKLTNSNPELKVIFLVRVRVMVRVMVLVIVRVRLKGQKVTVLICPSESSRELLKVSHLMVECRVITD